MPRLATSPLVYVRLHGHERRYQGGYPEAVLADWAGWLAMQQAAGHPALVYFDNTMAVDHALRDAQALGAMLTDSAGPA